MRAIIFLSAFLLFSKNFAQQKTDSLKVFNGVQVSAIPALASFNFSSINGALASNALPQIKDGLQIMPAFSISSHSYSDDFFFDVTAGFNRSSNSSNGSSLEYQGIFSELGFNKYVINKNRKYLFFGVAYGSVWHNLNIYNNVNAGSFAGALIQNSGSVKMNSDNNQYVALKSGFDWSVDRQEDLLIGIRLGYRIGLGNQKWEIKGQSYNDSPTTSASGFFMGIAITMR